MNGIKKPLHSMLNKEYKLKWIIVGFLIGGTIQELLRYFLNQLF